MLRGLKSIVLLGREGRQRVMRFRFDIGLRSPTGPIISAHGETVGPCFPQTFRVPTGRFIRERTKIMLHDASVSMKRPVGTQGDFCWTLPTDAPWAEINRSVRTGRQARVHAIPVRYWSSVPKGPFIPAHGETVGERFPQTFRVPTGRFIRGHPKIMPHDASVSMKRSVGAHWVD